MNRQALVGIFTIITLIALFGVFVVLGNYGTQGRYKIGVHFKSAAGLHRGAPVYDSGVRANRAFTRLSARLDSRTSTLQVALQQSSANLTGVTAQLDSSLRRNTGHFDSIVAALDNSARDLNRTADHVTSLASNPQLRDTLANVDAAAQKANSLLA